MAIVEDKLVYDVKVGWQQLARALRLFKKKDHRGFYFEVKQLKDDVFHLKVFKCTPSTLSSSTSTILIRSVKATKRPK